VCCLLVLNSVTSTPQWIRMDKNLHLHFPKMLVGIILHVMKYQTRVSKIHILNLSAIVATRVINESNQQHLVILPMWLSYTLEQELVCSGFDQLHLCAYEFAAHLQILISNLVYEWFICSFENSVLLFLICLVSLLRGGLSGVWYQKYKRKWQCYQEYKMNWQNEVMIQTV